MIDIESSRALIQRCAWVLDQGGNGRHESSVAKAHVAEAVVRVVDRAVQICGALGVSGDAPLARLMNEVRPFRIYDGSTETHLWSIARRTLRARAADVSRFSHRMGGEADLPGGPVSDVVGTPAQAAGLELEPLLVLEPLAAFLDAVGLGAGPIEATAIGDGHSNVTYLLRRGEEKLVLRRPPRGPLPPSAHDVLREARLLSALGPQRLPGAGGAGELRGRGGDRRAVLRDALRRGPRPRRDPAGAARRRGAAADRRANWSTASSTCTRSTSRPPGSPRFGRADGYLARQIKRFGGLLELNATRPLPDLERVAEWLAANLPESPPATVVHGDYRLGNVMFAADAAGAGRGARLGDGDDRRPARRPRLHDRDVGRGERPGRTPSATSRK